MLPGLRNLLRCALVCGCLAASGCQSLLVDAAPPDPALKQAATATDSEHLGTLSVEFHPVSGGPERAQFEIQQTTFVQSALEQTGALDRFGRVKIYLYRRQPGQSLYTRLTVPFDTGKGRVPSSSDYALRGGDRLVIIEDPSNFVDDLMGSLNAGVLSNMLPR